MPRSGEDARRRLQDAALALFRERGYDHTTTAEIAAQAGVTERTFFRHFPDKREVLFESQEKLATALTQAIAEAPQDLSPMAVLQRAFQQVAPRFEANRSYSLPRQELIERTPILKERETSKLGALSQTLAVSLERRGIDGFRAQLAARSGMAIFALVLDAWFKDPSRSLADYFSRAFVELGRL
ncbi:MAG: TetR family transcriptional regulator [Rhodobacteraceae bacterium]|nr:TetR family transcriptional regulator [Paracoccaceae bacterium]